MMNANLLKVLMPSDKLKNAREWGTFVLSLICTILIPVGIIVLKNQRLENEKWVSDNFLSQRSFADYRSDQKSWADKDAAQVQAQIASVNAKSDKVEAKVDAVSAKVDASLMSLNSVQAQLQVITKEAQRQ